jgi:HSP20 family protein
MSIRDTMHWLLTAFMGRGVGKADRWSSGSWNPAVDIYETDDALIVKAELAGFAPGDVNVEIKEHALLLRGSRRRAREVDEAHYHCMEWAVGAFQRFFLLPTSIDREKMTASYKNGVLRLRLPKIETANLVHRHHEMKRQST